MIAGFADVGQWRREDLRSRRAEITRQLFFGKWHIIVTGGSRMWWDSCKPKANCPEENNITNPFQPRNMIRSTLWWGHTPADRLQLWLFGGEWNAPLWAFELHQRWIWFRNSKPGLLCQCSHQYCPPATKLKPCRCKATSIHTHTDTPKH